MQKSFKSFSLIVALTITTTMFSAFAQGNGSPSGAHYNLNVIGVSNPKTSDMSTSNGHVIFVPLTGKVSISLVQGDFQVLDANGTDGKASFQLPAPDSDNDGITNYSVYVRALGKPGGSSTTTPYIVDSVTGETWMSTGSVTMTRQKGKSTFTNVSKDLLYVTADIDGDGIIDKMPLFGDSTKNYFWEYDNKGLQHAQFRFYEVPTDTN